MSLLRFLGLDRTVPGEGTVRDTETIRRVVGALEGMEPEQARYVARFAYILGRVASADQHVSPEETRTIERIVMERGRLPESQAVLVVQISKAQQALFGATDDYLVTRDFAANATQEQKLALLDCCFAVSAADEDVSGPEDDTVRKIAKQLGLNHDDFIAARSAYRDYLAVLKPPRPG